MRRWALTLLAAGALAPALAACGRPADAAGEPAPRPSRRRRPRGERPRSPGPRSDQARLSRRASFGGPISPKSVAASGTGLVFAQNMMYRHSVTVYDARRMHAQDDPRHGAPLAARLPAVPRHPAGAPVEAAFAPDGRHAYVSNYSMYGPGFGPEGSDVCSPASGYDRSFVYRIPLASLEIDAYRVGAVPKVVAVTRDGRYVLASNWCSYDLSVISTRRGREVRRVPIGAYPRGIVVRPRTPPTSP